MRSPLLVAAAAAAVAAAGALLLARAGSAPGIAPPAPVAVRAALGRSVVEFGDPVTARVVVTLDRSAVRAETLRLRSDLVPFSTLGAPETRRTVSGDLETVSITQRVACLTAPCLAGKVALPQVRATVTTRRGTTARVEAQWRPLQVRGRVTAADLAASTPHFVADTTPTGPSYRVSPRTAATVLDVVAALAAAGAGALLALEAIGLARRRRRPVTGDELARAVALVREAEERPPPDRRRALALLARLLHRRGNDGLARDARDLAWSEPEPERRAVDALVVRVEQDGAG